MKVWRTAIGIFLFSGAVFSQTRSFDIQLFAGDWTLSPFRTAVERESEDLIRNECSKLIGSAIPEAFLSPVLSNVKLSSSGHFFSLALWYRIGRSRFSAGVRGDYFLIRLPYFLSVEESLGILGSPLATIKGEGRGTILLNGLAISFLGRWTPISTRRVDLSLQAGVLLLPFQGKIFLDQTTALSTPLGDSRLSGSFDHTFAEVRELGLDLPSLIVSPTLGIELRYRFIAESGIFINMTTAQGAFYAGGLFFSF